MNNANTLYQYGTLAMLVPGLFEGTLPLKELLKHGDTGIGTGDGLDGELIILDGVAYQIDGEGNVNELDDDFMVPFGDVHFASFEHLANVHALVKMEDLEEKVSSNLDWNNVFYSVRAHGTFKSVKTRSVHKQDKPYPTLVECAHKQNEFEAEDVEGTLIGYFSPQLFNGAAVGGFHLHFLADDKSLGGHLLDFEMVSGDIKVQKLDELVQKLPSSNDDFMKHDFSRDDIAGAIGEAE